MPSPASKFCYGEGVEEKSLRIDYIITMPRIDIQNTYTKYIFTKINECNTDKELKDM